MSKLSRLFFVLLLMMLFHGLGTEASACSCRFGGGAPCEEFWRADVVFSGRVTGSSEITVEEGSYKFSRRVVRIAVEQRFRGEVESVETEVITGWGGGDCGYGFKLGERYMVYAFRDEKDRRLHTGICSRTRPLAQAGDDLAYARELATKRDETGTVFGRIVKRNFQWKEGDDLYLPVTGVDVSLEGQGRTYRTKADAQGRFNFNGLSPGGYRVKMKVPEGLTDESLKEDSSRMIEGDVNVQARGCAETGFYLEADTRVSGRVLDATAQPVANLRLEMRPAPGNNYNTFLYAQTDAEGRFEFKPVPPGSYILGFRILGSSQDEPQPYARVYYPGVPSRAQAGVISVKEGERVRGLELRLLPRLEVIDLEGVVTWADGRAASGAEVTVSLFEEGEMTNYRWIKTDERGRFATKVFGGATYRISATLANASGATMQSKWIDLQAAPGQSPFKLLLPMEAEKPPNR